MKLSKIRSGRIGCFETTASRNQREDLKKPIVLKWVENRPVELKPLIKQWIEHAAEVMIEIVDQRQRRCIRSRVKLTGSKKSRIKRNPTLAHIVDLGYIG